MQSQHMNWAQRNVGEMLIFISIVHSALGVWPYLESVFEAQGNGWFNQFTATISKADEVNMWFMVLGIAMFILGIMAREQIRATGTLPWLFGICLIVASMLSLAIMPVNGIWTVLGVGVVALTVSRIPSQKGKADSRPMPVQPGTTSSYP